MSWATFWAIFLPTHLVTLAKRHETGQDLTFSRDFSYDNVSKKIESTEEKKIRIFFTLQASNKGTKKRQNKFFYLFFTDATLKVSRECCKL
jgi:hypothetical protein